MRNGAKEQSGRGARIAARSAKELAFSSVFVALSIGAQTLFSAVPGVEFVTVLFVCYAFSFGICRGAVSATAFSLLRCFVFGFFPTVIILYLVYYNFLAATFGILGLLARKRGGSAKFVFLAVPLACVCTVIFTLIDCVITPAFYGFTEKATKAYFVSAMPFMIPQVICTAVSVGVLFLPLTGVFSAAARQAGLVRRKNAATTEKTIHAIDNSSHSVL